MTNGTGNLKGRMTTVTEKKEKKNNIAKVLPPRKKAWNLPVTKITRNVSGGDCKFSNATGEHNT